LSPAFAEGNERVFGCPRQEGGKGGGYWD
jgi:hypothetical protein